MLDLMEIAGCCAAYNTNAMCIDLLLPDKKIYRVPVGEGMTGGKSPIATVFQLFTEVNQYIK